MSLGDDGDFESMLQPRATERFGGRESVGSALWLEHVASISFVDESGSIQVLTPQDLADDEIREAAEGYPRVVLDKIPSQDADLVTKETWLRSAFLPMLPVKIVGDASQPQVRFDAELEIFRVPRDLARYSGVITEARSEQSEAEAIALSVRLLPTEGRVEAVSVYPGYTDERYGITAVEFEPEVVRLALGYQKYLELYREPRADELPDLTAPHQF